MDKTRICERTHEAAEVAQSRESATSAGHSHSAAPSTMLGEARRAPDKMACALGSAPLFGMIGGPELGHAYGDKASFACVMYSCLVFQ